MILTDCGRNDQGNKILGLHDFVNNGLWGEGEILGIHDFVKRKNNYIIVIFYVLSRIDFEKDVLG